MEANGAGGMRGHFVCVIDMSKFVMVLWLGLHGPSTNILTLACFPTTTTILTHSYPWSFNMLELAHQSVHCSNKSKVNVAASYGSMVLGYDSQVVGSVSSV